jgi:N-acetylmuramoyl-L-alanine amidase
VARKRADLRRGERLAPPSAAYREAYARRRRRLRRKRLLVAAALIALTLGGAGLALALNGNGGRVRVTQYAGQATTTVTVTTKAPGRPAASVTRARATPNASSATSVPRPTIVWKPIPFSAQRKAETAAYSRHHYGISSWRLTHPKVIVEHFTATPSFSSAYNTFASDTPDPELGELPGTCAHFIVDSDGTIYQLVPLSIICRHTVGLNYTAVGIEHVGMSDADILDNPRQLQSSLRLTLWLMQQLGIKLANVIGHNESLTSPFRHELYAGWRCQTHGDWTRADMNVYRSDLQTLARRYRLQPGPPAPLRSSNC